MDINKKVWALVTVRLTIWCTPDSGYLLLTLKLASHSWGDQNRTAHNTMAKKWHEAYVMIELEVCNCVNAEQVNSRAWSRDNHLLDLTNAWSRGVLASLVPGLVRRGPRAFRS